MSSAHHTHTHTHLHASHTHKHVLKSESKFSNTATAKSDTNINTNTSPHTLLTQSHTRTQLHIAERKWVMHSLPLKRPSSSGRAVWQHYLRDGGLNKLPPTLLATLTGAAPPCVWRLMQQPSRTGQITDEHASLLKTWRHTHTHIQVHVLTCTRVVAKYFQRVGRLRSASRGRQRKYAFKWRRRLQGWRKCNEMLPDICTHACMATPKC